MAKYNKEYKRDGRAPVPSDPKVSYAMSRIRAKNTKPELAVRRALWAKGIKGYRLHPKSIPGKPDICFIGKKKAIFVHGCFWHSCPHCQPKRPQTNKSFWYEKLDKNVARDERKAIALKSMGFAVCTLWECEIKRDLESAIAKLIEFVSD